MEICRNAHLGIQPDPHWKVREMMFIFMSNFIGHGYHLGNAKVQGSTILVVYFSSHIFLYLWQVTIFWLTHDFYHAELF